MELLARPYSWRHCHGEKAAGGATDLDLAAALDAWGAGHLRTHSSKAVKHRHKQRVHREWDRRRGTGVTAPP